MEATKSIIMSKEELDEAVRYYLSISDVTYNVDEIIYITDGLGEMKHVLIKAR